MIHDVLVPRGADGLRQRLARDALDGLLARGIDVRQHQNVGLIERAAEILPEMLRARVAVRLEEHQQALVTAAARRFERGANFGGMMAVVVDQRDAVDDALDFKPPPTPRKFLEPRADQIRGNIQRQRRRPPPRPRCARCGFPEAHGRMKIPRSSPR